MFRSLVVDCFGEFCILDLQQEKIDLLGEIKTTLDEMLSNREEVAKSLESGVWKQPEDVLEQRFRELKQHEQALSNELISLRKEIARLRTLRKLKISALVMSSIVISGFAVKYYLGKFHNSGVFRNLFNVIFK